MTSATPTRPTNRSNSRPLRKALCAGMLACFPLAQAQKAGAIVNAVSAEGFRWDRDAAAATLPSAPSALLGGRTESSEISSSRPFPLDADVDWVEGVQSSGNHGDPRPTQQKNGEADVDSSGKAIPVDRHQPHRIGGIIPNYRAVSGGAVAHAPGWKYNFKVASRQAFDYSGFVFLGITSASAEGLDEHKSFGKGIGGFWTYTWHGFLDKTDGTYLQAWLLPSLLHEDTRYYALGNQHRPTTRLLYVISRQAVARTYGGRNTPNIAGLGGKVLTQYISRSYYPTNTANFATLAQKFGYGVAREIGFTALREFYPDYLGYQERKRQRKAAAQSALDTGAGAAGPSQGATAALKPM